MKPGIFAVPGSLISMGQIGKKAGIIFLIIFWFFLITVPALSIYLAVNTQLQIGAAENNHLRIFLVQEKNAEGLGFEIIRPFPSTPSCAQTTITYWMWKGKPENVTFCQCNEQQSNARHFATPGGCSFQEG